MDLQLNEIQNLVMRSARDFADRTLRPVAAKMDEEGELDLGLLRELAELGLMGVNIPASLGGAEAGVVSYAVAMMEIARGCASTAVTMAVTNMVGEVIAKFGTEEQRQRHVTRLVSGEYAAGAFALSVWCAGPSQRMLHPKMRPRLTQPGSTWLAVRLARCIWCASSIR